MANDFDIEIEVPHQSANDLKLLVILAAEKRYLWPDDIKELGTTVATPLKWPSHRATAAY
jgi:hypothetical protein